MVSLKQIFDWFREGLEPDEIQFKESWSSFWHKSERLPIQQVFGLNDELFKLDQSKASKEDLANAVSGTNLLGERENENEIKAITNPKKGDTYRAKDTGDYWKYDGENTESYDSEKWLNIGTILPSDAARKADLPKINATKNLFNKEDILIGWYQPSYVAGLTQGDGWACTRYISVSANTVYTLSGAKGRAGIGFYDKDKKCIGYLGIVTGTFTTPENTAFVVINLASPQKPYWSLIQLELGDTATEYKAFNQVVIDSLEKGDQINKSIEDSAISKRIADRFIDVVNTNLINPFQVQGGYLVDVLGAGAIIKNNAYAITELIPIELLSDYTGVNLLSNDVFRNAAFYNDMGVYIAGLGDSLSSFKPIAGTKFVRLSLFRTDNDDYSSSGLFKGKNPTFKPYNSVLELKDKRETSSKSSNEIASIQDVKNILDNSDLNLLAFSITDNASKITFKYDIGTITGLIKSNRGYEGNNMFNFSNFNIFNNSVNNGDDVAPMHIMNVTIGANHGHPAPVATITDHGKDNTHIGTAWQHTNGETYYIMRINSDSQITFLSKNKGTPTDFTFPWMPVGELTRDGETMTVSAVTLGQLYPAIKNLSLKVLKNGKDELVENGDYKARCVDIVESYDIMNVDDILNNIIARVDSSDAPVYDGETMVTVENIYRFTASPTCLVISNIIPKQKVRFADFMFTQAIPIAANVQSTSLKYYVPNSLPIGNYDFRKPLNVAWSSSVPALYFGRTNWQDENNPPNRVLQYYGYYGFALGFLPFGVGKSLQDYTNRTFELRNDTGKVYPHGVEGSKIGTFLNVGDVYSAVMYRTFFATSTAKEGRMSIYNFDYNNSTYLFVDYSASMIDRIDLNDSTLNGRKIEVVESVNCELKNDVYNNGIYINAKYVEGETCFVVLKID